MITVGIPRSLTYYRYFPLWHAFFRALNCTVCHPPEPPAGGPAGRSFFEDSCFPVKRAVARAVALKGSAHVLFLPRLVATEPPHLLCPKFRAVPDLCRLALEGKGEVLDPTLDCRSNSWEEVLVAAGRKLGATEAKSRHAAREAEVAFSRFGARFPWRVNFLPLADVLDESVADPPLGQGGGGAAGELEAAWLAASAAAGDGPVVAVVGHPYNLLDPEISGGALTRLRSYGAGLLLPTGLPSPISARAAARLDHAAKTLYWSSGREILGAALAVLENWWADGLLFLTSFKCGVDALLVEVLARLVKELPRERPPFCILTLDEQGGGEVLATRLEALCDVALAARRRRPAATPLG